MARPRAYNHDIRCPECGSNRMPKNGASPGRQVYRCGDYGRHYTHGAAYTRPSSTDREPDRALLGTGSPQAPWRAWWVVTPPAVHRWVKRGVAALSRLRRRR